MKVFTIAGPKGGCGKSVATSALAVRAVADGGKVAMIDLDEGQATLTEWWTQRGKPASPFLYDEEGTLDALVDGLRADKWAYCFIDGPPHEQDLIEMSVFVADAVLIPVKLSYFDAATIDSIVGLCERHRKPYAFVINEFDDRKLFANANAVPLAMLEERGHVMKTPISYHPKHRIGQIQGKTGAELAKELATEIDALWSEVKKLAGVGPARKVMEGRRRG